MRKLFTLLFLIGTCFAQTVNTNFYPAQSGLSLGRNGQRWNVYANNIDITGTITVNGVPVVGVPGPPGPAGPPGSVGTPGAPGSYYVTSPDATLLSLQSKPVIDVRDISGVDCTGTTDSSTALNNLWDSRLGGNINGKQIVIPPSCKIRTDHPLVIFGQDYWTIDGGGREPTVDNGAAIFGCGTDTGAVLQITRSGLAEIRGLAIEAKGISCSSGFTGSVLLNNEVAGGVTTTDIAFVNDWFSPNRANAHITNYVAIQLGVTSGNQNTERIKVRDSYLYCATSAGSKAFSVLGNNSDHLELTHNNIDSCFFGIYGKGGGMITGNNFYNIGSYPTFGSGGANIYATGCAGHQLLITGNELAESSGQLFRNDVGGCDNVVFEGNIFASTALDPAVHLIDVGVGIRRLSLFNNQFDFLTPTSLSAVGTSLAVSVVGYTNLTEFGNQISGNTGGLLQNIPWAGGMLALSDTNALLTKSLTMAPQQPASGTLGNPSPFLTLRSNQDSSGSKDYDFVLGTTTARVGGSETPTLYIDRTLPNNSLGVMGIMPSIAGGIKTAAVTWGSQVPIVATVGAAGSTSYTYVVCGMTATGCSPSTAVVKTTGNATLDSTNYTQVQWFPIPGAAQYWIYRTASAGTPSSTGLIGTMSASGNTLGNYTYFFNDTGLAGDSTTAPTVNTADGRIQMPLITPASSSAACAIGQIVVDAGFLYVCTAANTWKRAALSAF